jgi:serine/threonine-protein kinase RsbW
MPAGQFSTEVLNELLRALAARAHDHPESPGLIASWPGVPAERMPAACAELARQGHPVHEVAIVGARAKVSRGWVVDLADSDPPAASGPAVELTGEPRLLVREPAVPATVALARAAIALIDGLSAPVREALAIAVTEACANVALHAYADADAPGQLEVRAFRTDAVLTVEVADAGRGMIPHLEHEGLGLGLPLIAQVADAVELRSDGSGSTVRMRFSTAFGR